MSYAELEIKVVRWGEQRGIVQHGKPVGQARKCSEESGELIEATAKIGLMRDLLDANPTFGSDPEFLKQFNKATDEAQDAIGDVLVTLIMCAATLDVDVVRCLQYAYDEIKDRKGHLRPDGVFVREQ